MIIVIPRENPTQCYLQEMNLKYKDRRLLKVKKEKEMPSNAKHKNTAISLYLAKEITGQGVFLELKRVHNA